MFALDTNTVIYFFKGMGRVAERLLETPPREVAEFRRVRGLQLVDWYG